MLVLSPHFFYTLFGLRVEAKQSRWVIFNRVSVIPHLKITLDILLLMTSRKQPKMTYGVTMSNTSCLIHVQPDV